MTVERFVLDTNVLIGAALTPAGRPRAVVDAIRDAHGVLLFSEETLLVMSPFQGIPILTPAEALRLR